MSSTRTLAPAAQSYCLFQRGGVDFALPVRVAERLLASRPLTRVPFAPPDLCGALIDRGRIVPLVVLDRWLGLVVGRAPADGVWLLIDDGNVALAVVVDRVLGVARFAGREIKRALAHPMAVGMVAHEKRTVVLLDADRLVPAITGSLVAALPQGASLPT